MVPARNVNVIIPPAVETWIPAVPASASGEVIVPMSAATVIRVPSETELLLISLIMPLMIVLTETPSAGKIAGSGVRAIVP